MTKQKVCEVCKKRKATKQRYNVYVCDMLSCEYKLEQFKTYDEERSWS